MDALQDEVESLVAILMDDVRVKQNAEGAVEIIETTVLPLTDERDEQQCICVTLQVLPKPGYPDVSPDFKLLRPRGLDDARLEAMRSACLAKIKDSIGFPVVFDLIEIVREQLTDSNLPSGQCVICLYGFSDGDEITRTECFHYLHSYCLARHLNALRRSYQEEYEKLPAWLKKTAEPFQAACPVCRERIKDESESLRCAMPPAELENAPEFRVTNELRELQQRMSTLYLQQKSRGAIIDVDADVSAVLSIETEEEIRRREQRKKREEAEEAAAAARATIQYDIKNASKEVKPTSSSSSSSGSGGSNVAHNKYPAKVIVPEAKADALDTPSQSNHNNYTHNRRHFRGGRRHQHHHHHNSRGDRDAGCSNAASNNGAGAGAGSGAGANSTNAAMTATNVNHQQHHQQHHKQPKNQAHNR